LGRLVQDFQVRGLVVHGLRDFLESCLAAALIGVGTGGGIAITPYLLTRYFGLRAFPLCTAAIMNLLLPRDSNSLVAEAQQL
jgi:hypothetical protein